jgi:hypothetical protein
MQELKEMKCRPDIIINNQRGSVINVALLILILIFLVGIGLSKISTTDIKIAGNMKTAATTFYEADAGLDAASELAELNVLCPRGFGDTKDDSDSIPLPAGWVDIEGTFMVTDNWFWLRETADEPAGNPDPDEELLYPGTLDEDIVAYYPADYEGEQEPDRPHTNISIGSRTRYARGSAIQMAAGYEGLGKGAAGGGGSIIFDIYSMHYGERNSKSDHFIQWVHLIKAGEICDPKYK